MTNDDITVENIRSEFRHCLFNLCFQQLMHDLEKTELANIAYVTIMNILAFGINSKLITQEEYNEWQMVVRKDKTLIDIVSKYKIE